MSNNSNKIKNIFEKEKINNNNQNSFSKIYRNGINNLSVSDNNSTLTGHSRHYINVDKFLLNKYIKNSNNNKIKIIKNKM